MPFLPVVVAAALLLGVAAGASWPSLLAPGAVLAAVAWAATIGAWRTGRGAAVVVLALCAVSGLGVVLGAAAMRRALAPSLVTVLESHGVLPADGARGVEPVRVEGRLLADASPSGRVVLLRIAVRRIWIGPCGCAEAVDGQVLASVGGQTAHTAMAAWRAGRVLTFPATLRRPLFYRNPGAPDAAIDLARRRAVLLASVKSAFVVDVSARGSWASEAAAAVRARARQAIARAAAAADDAAAVGTAVLIGDRAGLDAPLEDRLQRAGTFHVIAISGGNIALWSMMSLWLAARLTRRRPLALAVTALALIAYAGVVGGGASVLRATGMALVGIATQWIDQRGAALNVLALTAAALVVADPIVVFDVGFWLTTAATAGLVLGLPSAAAGESRVVVWTRTLVLTSVWAEAALLPIVAAVFQQVTLAGVVLSAAAIPGMAVVQLAALAAVMADVAAPGLVGPCGLVLRAGSAVVLESARLVDAMPWLTWRVPPPAVWAVAAYYASIAAWLWARRPSADTARAAAVRRAARVAAPCAAVWVAVSPATLVPAAPGELRVTTFDVGQGDAILVEAPNGRRLLVDAGGASSDGRDLGGRVVGPALRALGIRRLDYLVVTHADLDHIGGAATLVREFRPAEVWIGIPVADDAGTARLRAAAGEVRAAWREVRRGERLDLGAVRLDIAHPPPPEWERQRVRNDDSVVLAVRHGQVRIVLTGDLGVAAEPDVLQAVSAGAEPPAALTVLKVAHHGSAGATSRDWLEALRPAVAVVSAGAANPFGHPAPATLERLRSAGADVWRTDRDGAITIRTTGVVAEVTSHTGRRRRLQPR